MLGGVGFLAALAAAIFWRRKILQSWFEREPEPSQELAGNEKVVGELTAKEESWELSSETKPVEMESSPIDERKKSTLKNPLSELGADVPRNWSKKP